MAIVLSEADVRELVPISDLIDVMERALAAFSSGQVDQPLRTCVEVGANRDFFGIMPCSMHAPAAVGAKLVTVFPQRTFNLVSDAVPFELRVAGARACGA